MVNLSLYRPIGLQEIEAVDNHAHESGKVVSPMHYALHPSQEVFLGHSAARRIKSMKSIK
jgi:hypothetical protein